MCGAVGVGFSRLVTLPYCYRTISKELPDFEDELENTRAGDPSRNDEYVWTQKRYE